ncbi:hypothetical protein PHJA_001309100 [Phtheirospermum japonicum]|uniref:DC1 domain-containing protein n=1 Tax=Phtheirospermum japonicum TaxID=374723 RepID=A0A830CBN2_9LAMI|nr:hypothetical protein PHJA_001309100 [Phtheirospermum japonicum]
MEYKHFSHHHPLTLHKIQPGQQSQLCHGCQLPCNNNNNNGSIFACYSCNFFLHDHCGNANRYVKHPSHPAHPLVLVPTPTYCSGTFLCDGCGASGNAFSYCCPLCEIDLHVNCTFLPLKVTHNSHPHDLFLSFTAQADRVKPPDYCRVCRKEMSFRNWFYFCEKAGCDHFRVHTFCGTSEVKPGQYQDDQPEGRIGNSSGGENTSVHEHDQAQRTEWTPEEVALEIGRMRMEFEMAQALGNIIAYYPR